MTDDPMDTPLSWQSILENITRNPQDRQRLTAALGVSELTLSHWITGESIPQRQHLVRLLRVIDQQYYEELLEALERDFPDIENWLKDKPPEPVSSEFFSHVLNLRTTTTDALRFWHISDAVLKEGLNLLDPNHSGMALTICQCMPPSQGDKVRTLRERAGRGTPPWAIDLEHLTIFLGMESLAGYAVESSRYASVEDLRKDTIIPAFKTEHEISAAVYPIWLGGRVAGCLLASSTQVSYFTQQRIESLGTLSNLLSLAFDKSEFYPPRTIELRPLPPPEKQRPIIATFRDRVGQAIRNAAKQGNRLPTEQAEQQVWREIEEEILLLPGD